MLRAPVPDGWRIESVQIDNEDAKLIDGSTVELPRRDKPLTVRFKVSN